MFVYVSCPRKDADTLLRFLGFKQRWAFYTMNVFDFIHDESDRAASDILVDAVSRARGMIVLVTKNTGNDSLASREIAAANALGLPLLFVDARGRGGGVIAESFKDRICPYGWEWFAAFIDSL